MKDNCPLGNDSLLVKIQTINKTRATPSISVMKGELMAKNPSMIKTTIPTNWALARFLKLVDNQKKSRSMVKRGENNNEQNTPASKNDIPSKKTTPSYLIIIKNVTTIRVIYLYWKTQYTQMHFDLFKI